MTEFCPHIQAFTIVRMERLRMPFTANGKMKFSFCQSTEILDLLKLLSCLLTSKFSKILRQDEKRKFS